MASTREQLSDSNDLESVVEVLEPYTVGRRKDPICFLP
jgi:hypothetical protein